MAPMPCMRDSSYVCRVENVALCNGSEKRDTRGAYCYMHEVIPDIGQVLEIQLSESPLPTQCMDSSNLTR